MMKAWSRLRPAAGQTAIGGNEARTTRADTTAGWRAVLSDLIREPLTEQVELSGLSAADTARCAEAASDRPLSGAAGAALHSMTGGNPFFVREVARSLSASAGSDVTVPASVIDLITARVERLSPLTRRLLGAAAVLGEQFAVAIVASLIDQPVIACMQSFHEARDSGLLEPAATAGEWRFGHGLMRDAVEAGLSIAEKADLHRMAAQAIERRYAGHLAPRLADLARHWAVVAVTGERANAIEWAVRAGDEAVRGLAYEEGARLFQMALDIGDPDLGEEQRCRLLIDLADAQWRSSDLEGCRTACEKAVAIAQRIGRPDLIGDAALTVEPIGDLAWDLNVRRWCDDALSAAPESETAYRARLLARATEASIYLGEHAAADQASRTALALADRSADGTAVIAALGARQLACSGPENLAERDAIATRMVEMGLGLRRTTIELRGRLWVVDILWERGDLAGIAATLGRLDVTPSRGRATPATSVRLSCTAAGPRPISGVGTRPNRSSRPRPTCAGPSAPPPSPSRRTVSWPPRSPSEAATTMPSGPASLPGVPQPGRPNSGCDLGCSGPGPLPRGRPVSRRRQR